LADLTDLAVLSEGGAANRFELQIWLDSGFHSGTAGGDVQENVEILKAVLSR